MSWNISGVLSISKSWQDIFLTLVFYYTFAKTSQILFIQLIRVSKVMKSRSYVLFLAGLEGDSRFGRIREPAR